MAEKLSVIIALEGAEEIKRQLAEVSTAGKDCFNDINQAAAEVGGFNKLDPSVVTEKLNAAGVAGEDLSQVLHAVDSAGRMETLVNGIATVETALGQMGTAAMKLLPNIRTLNRVFVAAVGAAIVAAITSTVSALNELGAAAAAAGQSVETLSRMRQGFEAIGLSAKSSADAVTGFLAAADKIELESVQAAAADMKKFGVGSTEAIAAIWKLQAAAKGFGEAAKLAAKELRAVGLSPPSAAEDALERIRKSTLAADEKLLETIKVLDRLGDTAERNRLIMKVFGDTIGNELVRAFNAGGVEVEKFRQKHSQATQGGVNEATRFSLAWEKLKTAIGKALEPQPGAVGKWAADFEALAAVIDAFVARVGQIGLFATLREQAQKDLAALRAWAQADMQAVMAFFATVPGRIVGFFAGFGADLWANALVSAQMTVDQITGFFSALPGQIASFFADFGTTLWQSAVSDAQQAAQMIVSFFSQLPGQIAGFFSGLGGSLFDGLIAAAQAAVAKIKGFFSGLAGGGGGGDAADAAGFARGGFVGGRGSGTSDSNLAWVSRGEHIMPAYAVRQPGVLQLLEALRRSGGNLRSVLDRMGHFALGGMVGATPAFAGGGMSNVTIQFPGLPPIGGLRAPRSVVDELHRAAAMAQVRSGGRKPSRYS